MTLEPDYHAALAEYSHNQHFQDLCHNWWKETEQSKHTPYPPGDFIKYIWDMYVGCGLGYSLASVTWDTLEK